MLSKLLNAALKVVLFTGLAVVMAFCLLVAVSDAKQIQKDEQAFKRFVFGTTQE